MKKTLITLFAAAFALMFGAAQAAEAPKADAKKEDAVAKACKDKKAGTEVTVDGKKVKCPAPKK